MSHRSTPASHPDYVGIGLDYIGATVVGEGNQVLDELAKATGLEPRTTRPPPGHGYRQCVGLFGGDTAVLRVLYTPGRDPHVVAYGHETERVHAILANRFPLVCSAARKDVAVDFGDPDFFEVLYATATEIANRRGIGISLIGDWPVPGSPKGRTAQFGSRESELFVRLYEYRKCHGYGPAVRLELEIKPKGLEAKRELFVQTERAMLGRSVLVVETLDRVGLDLSRTVPRFVHKPPTDLERATNSLVAQYGKTLRERILPALDNDAARLGPYLVAALEALEHDRAEISRAAAGASDLCAKSFASG